MFEQITNTHTRRAYARHWDAFRSSGARLDVPGVEGWLGTLAARGVGQDSLTQARAAVVKGARELWMRGELGRDDYLILKEIETPRAGRGQNPARWLTLAEVQAVQAELERARTQTMRARNRVLFLLLATLGLRRAEAEGLTWADWVSRGGREQLRVRGKRSTVAWVDVPPVLSQALQVWRELLLPDAEERTPILRRVWKSGKVDAQGMGADAIYRVIRAAGLAAGVGVISPHDLRHTVAELLDQAGVPIEQVSRLLRHSSVEMTRRYQNTARGAEAGMVMGQLLAVAPQQLQLSFEF